MPASYLKAVLQPGQCANLLLKTLGGHVVRAEHGEAEIAIPASPDFCQGGGLVGGGILATLADEAMAHAVLTLLDDETYTVTLDMTIHYLRAARSQEGRTLVAHATLVKRGRTVMVAESRVSDDDGRLLATASATFLLTRKAEGISPP